MSRRPHRGSFLRFLAVAGLAASAIVPVSLASAQAEDMVPFAITIRHISCVNPCSETDSDSLESTGEKTPDFYAKVFIDGVKQPPGSDADDPSTPRIEDDSSIDPFWTISTQIPASVVNVPVAIQVWDHDSTSGDDLGDASPLDDDNNLDFRVDRQTGKWIDPTGRNEVTWPQNCYSGDGDAGSDEDQPPVKVCFDIGGDLDGDGLLDRWERPVSDGGGYDDNGDGIVDVDLNAMGANPECKDLFLELDESPAASMVSPNAPITRADVRAMKAAFAAAPATSGSRAGEREGGAGEGGSEDTFGVSAPPDRPGCRGINLHVDAGTLVDATAREGQPAGTCTDGVDNGTDGLIDGADPSCTSGPETHLDSGAENPVGAPNCTDLAAGAAVDNDGDGLANGADPDCLVGDPEFATAGRGGGGALAANPGACGLDGNFYTAKNSYTPATPTAGLNPNRRFLFRYAIHGDVTGCSKPTGGQGELGGNDFISFNAGAGTILHELGHTLNLFHGGLDHEHCKPNYVSVMNYNLQFGIPRNTGGTILDFSPPRIALDGSSRGSAPLSTLDEDELDESVILDAGDTANKFAFTNQAGTDVKTLLSQRPDWNGDGDTGDSDLEFDIDDDGTDATPKACDNESEDDLKGADDWTFASLSFHNFGDAANGAIRPETEDVPTTQDFLVMRRSLNTTDLAISVTDAPDPVAAGTDLTYTVTVTNKGPNSADSVQVSDTLPGDVVFKSSTGGCQANGSTLACPLGNLAAGASRSFEVIVGVPADLVYNNGGPKTISSTVQVQNLIGPEPTNASGDNTATATTQVIAVADVQVTRAQSTGPLEVLIGQNASASLSVDINNAGPSSPIDTVLTTAATGAQGVTVTPTNSTSAQNALAVGSPRTVSFTFTLDCTSPGVKTVNLSATLALKNAVDVDPDLSNNTGSASFQIDCVVPMVINVRPGGSPNSINLNTDATVAALTTQAGEYGLPLDFNATAIDVSRTLWGLRGQLFNVAAPTGAAEIHGEGHPERSYELDDRTRDADLDLILHFKPSESGLTRSSTEACLKGKYSATDGNTYTFLGCDSVRVVR